MMKESTTSTRPKKSAAVFRSVREANRWLRRRRSIVILNLRTDAHHSKLQRIIIDYITYPQAVNIRYGIEKTTYLSRRRSPNPQTHADRWSSGNTCKEFVLCESLSPRLYLAEKRGLQNSLIQSSFITLYKIKKACSQPII